MAVKNNQFAKEVIQMQTLSFFCTIFSLFCIDCYFPSGRYNLYLRCRINKIIHVDT